MTTRPILRNATKLLTTTPIVRTPSSTRNLHITDPSNIHDTTSQSDSFQTSRRPQSPITLATEDPAQRDFSTTSRKASWGDTSTIDFAYLPSVLDSDRRTDGPIRVPVLLSTMYSGAQARAMYEDEPEAQVKPLINLISADSTHISSPSALSEVLDNNSVVFEGLDMSGEKKEVNGEGSGSMGDAVRQAWRELFK